eukprot:665143-Pyramimonas_sp.AAC.1
MKRGVGEDYEKWSDIGCRAKPRPRTAGPSVAVEPTVGEKREAFVAERLPQKLGNATRGGHCEFYDAAQKVSPEELRELIPPPAPVTRQVEGGAPIA